MSARLLQYGLGALFVLAALWAQPRASFALQMIAEITTDTVTDFGTYHPHPVNVVPSALPYTIAPDLRNIVNFGQFTFTNAQKTMLRRNGFVAFPQAFSQSGPAKPFGEMYDVYNYARQHNLAMFVTVDALLHTYHKVYDQVLRTVETRRLLGDLDRLTTAVLAASRAQYDQATQPKVRAAALANAAYLAVASRLLNTSFTIPGDVAASVTAELALINSHTGPARSPIFGCNEDYGQYVVRGHYTVSPELGRYFLAMTWYGRMTFHSEADSLAGVTTDTVREATRQAVMLTQAMLRATITTETAQAVWNRIYLPTTFFVGKSDDLSVVQYVRLVQTIYGNNFAAQSADTCGDESKLTAFLNAVAALPDPLIAADEWGKGFRFMGQRSIPDSHLFEQLVLPRVPTRTLPRGLDVMAVLGSARAFEILDQVYRETNHTSYVAQLSRLRTEFAALDDAVWAQNLYWNWLYCLMPMLAPKGPGFPTYMQNLGWPDKDLACALGSWTELRHDTLLYGKQSGTLGFESFAFRDAFVEANPWAFARLASLTRLMTDGLANLGLLDGDSDGRLRALEQLLLALKTIAEKELTNQEPTLSECRLVREIGRRLADLVIAGLRGNVNWDDDMAVIADVHSDYRTGRCLEEGVGRPLTIYVVNRTGSRLVLAMGSAFSYYEFAQPLANRLTDPQWQQLLSGNTPPSMPSWMGRYVDMSARFNLGAPTNALDPYLWEYQTTLTLCRLNPLPDRYAVQLAASYLDRATSVVLVATLGGNRKTGPLPWSRTAGFATQFFEGVLDLRGWPSGTVTVTVYAPENAALLKTQTFDHTRQTAVRPQGWRNFF